MRLKYWDIIRKLAKEIHSDGCTLVADFYLDCCLEHDIHHYFGHRISLISEKADGPAITFEDTNKELRKCIRRRSRFGKFSPLAWIRYYGVMSIFGKRIWDRHRKERP